MPALRLGDSGSLVWCVNHGAKAQQFTLRAAVENVRRSALMPRKTARIGRPFDVRARRGSKASGYDAHDLVGIVRKQADRLICHR
jgi:hypothetical protein